MEQYDEFWDAHHRDTSDLAVIVSGDITLSEGRF